MAVLANSQTNIDLYIHTLVRYPQICPQTSFHLPTLPVNSRLQTHSLQHFRNWKIHGRFLVYLVLLEYSGTYMLVDMNWIFNFWVYSDGYACI
jgi:hypothetical protein